MPIPKGLNIYDERQVAPFSAVIQLAAWFILSQITQWEPFIIKAAHIWISPLLWLHISSRGPFPGGQYIDQIYIEGDLQTSCLQYCLLSSLCSLFLKNCFFFCQAYLTLKLMTSWQCYCVPTNCTNCVPILFCIPISFISSLIYIQVYPIGSEKSKVFNKADDEHNEC